MANTIHYRKFSWHSWLRSRKCMNQSEHRLNVWFLPRSSLSFSYIMAVLIWQGNLHALRLYSLYCSMKLPKTRIGRWQRMTMHFWKEPVNFWLLVSLFWFVLWRNKCLLAAGPKIPHVTFYNALIWPVLEFLLRYAFRTKLPCRN